MMNDGRVVLVTGVLQRIGARHGGSRARWFDRRSRFTVPVRRRAGRALLGEQGVVGMTRAMALALASHGIRVNAIAPGLTDTAQPRYGNTDDELAEMAKAVPLGRMALLEEIAALGVFLASDGAAYITRQVRRINGGAYIG